MPAASLKHSAAYARFANIKVLTLKRRQVKTPVKTPAIGLKVMWQHSTVSTEQGQQQQQQQQQQPQQQQQGDQKQKQQRLIKR